ncbi:MAG TPA: cytochrome c oxidase assembly protein [bacterium]|nr:cytochrome c oxidase assembly protein [bacterium]
MPGIPLTWRVDPLLWLFCAGAGGLYLAGVQRYNSLHPLTRLPWHRPMSFMTGILVVTVALGSPVDAYADALFSVHMVQHLLLTMVAAPLLLLGTPLLLARHTGLPRVRRVLAGVVHSRAVRALLFPVVTWGALTAVMWGSHYSALYEAALEHPALHVFEHVLYLSAALLFWFPVVALEPSAWRMSHPLRLLYLFAAMPQNAFLGLSLYQSVRPLYPHYAALARIQGGSPLADQQAGGVVMWLLGGLLLVAALIGVAVSWSRHDAQMARHVDASLERSDVFRHGRFPASTREAPRP